MVGAGLGLGQRRGAFPILQTVLSSEGLGLWGGMAPSHLPVNPVL